MTMEVDGDRRPGHERLSEHPAPDDDNGVPRGGVIDGTVVMLVAAKVSIPTSNLPRLLGRT